MLISANNLVKKKVMDSQAHEVGIVTDFAVDTENWSVETLNIKIPAKTAKELGISKMLAKTAKVPVQMVSKVGDFLELEPTLKELVEQVETL